jgi:3',5'-cyclic-AMP phosphodiesterase
MKEKLVIAQISDIHIGSTEELRQGIDVRVNFLSAFAGIRKADPDLLVLSGDLSMLDGEVEAYHWILDQVKDFPGDVIVMSGNHDDPVLLADVFGRQKDLLNGTMCFRRKVRGHQLMFLDSSTNFVQTEQLQWLKVEASKTPDDEIILFMHHPPVLCGCLLMDNGFPLQNIEEVWGVLKEIPNIRNIFVGHYHTEKAVIIDGKNVFLAPSTYVQIPQFNPDSGKDHAHPGWRTIELSENQMSTGVHYSFDI